MRSCVEELVWLVASAGSVVRTQLGLGSAANTSLVVVDISSTRTRARFRAEYFVFDVANTLVERLVVRSL